MKNCIPKSFRLFGRAVASVRHEMWVSVQVLLLVTLLLALVMWLAEKGEQPGAFETYPDTVLWAFMWYFGDPGKFADYEPVTLVGRNLGLVIALVKIAIFAVPAGLVANGFRNAISKDLYDTKLDTYRKRMHKAFRRSANKTLREYLNIQKSEVDDKLETLNMVPQRIPVTRMQVRQGMEIKDIFEVCNRFSEFRLKNLAEAKSVEEASDERFVVEHFPLNTSYGCCINRHSNVTIVSPSNFADLGVGWFTYYLAKLGGFNYVSKEIEVDPDELDSFYNMSPEPFYNKKKRTEYSKKDKDALKMLDKKERLRKDFLADLTLLANRGNESWIIVITEHLMNSFNQTDFHFSDALKDGAQPTVADRQRYETLYKEFADVMQAEFNLSATAQSVRYPLLKNNLAYRLRKDGVECNCFVLRPSSHLINFDTKRLLVAFRMAQVISLHLDNGKGIEEKDVKDLSATGFGYIEKIKEVHY